ncbi:chaperonin CPN60-like protein 2, mitochondrial, partial [Tanacetum coccineum]
MLITANAKWLICPAVPWLQYVEGDAEIMPRNMIRSRFLWLTIHLIPFLTSPAPLSSPRFLPYHQKVAKRDKVGTIADSTKAATLSSCDRESIMVATIYVNGEREIGELIARAMEKVGKDGVITNALRNGNTLDNELEVLERMKLGR